MKKLTLILIIIAAAAVPGFSQSNAAGDSWQLNTGLNLSPGLLYNRDWDPGFSGSSALLMMTRECGILLLGAGLEAGYGYTGFSILFPLKAGIELTGSEDLKLFAAGSLMPGMIMARPSPYFLFAAGIAAELDWSISPDFSLSLSAGPRYTVSPGYSKAVAPLELMDLNIGIAAGFVL